jgi:hypothetical protein
VKRVGGEGGSGGAGWGGRNGSMYAHMNKCINKLKKKKIRNCQTFF